MFPAPSTAYTTLVCSLALFLQGIVNDPQEPARSPVFYVALNGSDAWSGRLASPNQNQTDGPFASFEAARAAVAAAHASGEGRGGTVFIRKGVYERTAPFVLSDGDSGAEGSPVRWSAYPGDTVIITGSRTLSALRQVDDPSLLQRLPPASRERVLAVNLRDEGITDYGTILPRGRPGLELFVRGERCTLARWPKTGWEHIVDVPQSGDSLLNEGLAREKRFKGVPVGRHYGRIVYPGDKPRHWRGVDDILLHGYWTWDWSDSYQRVAAIDTSRHEIVLAPPHHHYGYTTNQRFAFVNVLEELDTPGEWYLSRSRGFALICPDGPVRPEEVRASTLEGPLVVLDGTSHVRLTNLHFRWSRGNGVNIRGGSDNQVENCLFQELGDDAVLVDGGRGHRIAGSKIFHVALGGIRLRGGDRKTLAPGGHIAINNHIHHYSEWLRTGQYAVYLDGVGNTVSHTLIHDAPHEGIYLRGNDHVIEYNEFHDLMQETGDAGALHTGRDWTWRGNVIRYNYFHDLKGPGLHGVTAVYLDDFASGFTVFGNVLVRAGRAVELGGGRDNRVENNLFIACTPSIHIDARGLGWASYYIRGERTELYDLMDSVRATRPPYSTRYPELASLLKDQPAVPKGTSVTRNVSFGGRWLDVYDYRAFDFGVVTMRDNVIADSAVWRRRTAEGRGWDPYYLNIDMAEGYEVLKRGDPRLPRELPGNLFVSADPGIVFPVRGIPFLADTSAAYRLGFKPLPVERIGLER